MGQQEGVTPGRRAGAMLLLAAAFTVRAGETCNPAAEAISRLGVADLAMREAARADLVRLGIERPEETLSSLEAGNEDPEAATAMAEIARSIRWRLERGLSLSLAGDDGTFREALAALCLAPRPETLRGAAACGRLHGARCVRALSAFADHIDPEVRLSVARALAGLGDPSCGQALLRLLDDDDPRVIESAAQAARTCAPPDLAEPLLDFLERGWTNIRVLPEGILAPDFAGPFPEAGINDGFKLMTCRSDILHAASPRILERIADASITRRLEAIATAKVAGAPAAIRTLGAVGEPERTRRFLERIRENPEASSACREAAEESLERLSSRATEVDNNNR